MLKFRKLAALAMSIAMLTAVFTGCGDDENSSSAKSSGSESSESESSKSETPAASAGSVLNFTPPEKGEEIIVMTIKDYGDVKIKLFPEQAEKGVENFKGLAKDGYYDGLIDRKSVV